MAEPGGPRLGGATGKGWLPGQSGNPGGRRKDTLGEFIRNTSEGGQEFAVFAFGVFRSGKRKLQHRIWAVEWLCDRGWGRPAQSHRVAVEGQQDIYVFPPGTDPTTPDDALPTPLVLALRSRRPDGDDGTRGNGTGEIVVEPGR